MKLYIQLFLIRILFIINSSLKGPALLVYTKIGMTKEKICADINFSNNKIYFRTTYDRKESDITFDIYKQLADNLYNLHNNLCLDETNKDKILTIAVDGTYSNTNTGTLVETKKKNKYSSINKPLETSLNMVIMI